MAKAKRGAKQVANTKRAKDRPGLIVSAGWLREHLGDAKLRVIDLRWYLAGKKGAEEYAKGHVPGAVFLDLEKDLTAPYGPGRHPIPSGEQLADALARAGVADDATRDVVVYDDAGGSVAARLWWLANLYAIAPRVSVLDGGLRAWLAAGGALETGAPGYPRGEVWTTGARRGWVASRHDVVEHMDVSVGGVLLDARATERYRGEVEPVDARPGHVPGARSAPWSENLDPATGCFRPAEALRAHYASLGVGARTPVMCYCGSGVTACHDVLALALAGHDVRDATGRVRLYEGSWSDWARDPFRPAALGDEPAPGKNAKRA